MLLFNRLKLKIIAETDAKAQQIIDGAENKSQIIVQTANNEAQKNY